MLTVPSFGLTGSRSRFGSLAKRATAPAVKSLTTSGCVVQGCAAVRTSPPPSLFVSLRLPEWWTRVPLELLPLKMPVPPLAVVTLSRALRGRFDPHRRIARWTLPIWLYVSVTGVVVYLMLYRL